MPDTNERAAARSAETWSPIVRRAETGLLWSFVAVNVFFPAALLISGLPAPWREFFGEHSPINWFSSVQCALLGLIGLGIYSLSRLGRASGSDSITRSWPWLVLALGFFFLSLDEQFEIHEKVRDSLLIPRGVLTDVPGLKPGDIVLPLYAVAGVVMTFTLVADLKRHRRSLVFFVAALALIVVTAFQDSLSWSVLSTRPVRPYQIVAEEVGEVWSQALFAVSLVLVFFAKLRGFLGAIAEPQELLDKARRSATPPGRAEPPDRR